jgi:hypothetical protein
MAYRPPRPATRRVTEVGGRHRAPPHGEEYVGPRANSARMDSAPVVLVETESPRKRVLGWNWGLLVAVAVCIAFWSVLVAGALLLV